MKRLAAHSGRGSHRRADQRSGVKRIERVGSRDLIWNALLRSRAFRLEVGDPDLR